MVVEVEVEVGAGPAVREAAAATEVTVIQWE
jgi:hypothetical protein